MGRLCRFFAILIAAYTAAGCFSPIGSIGGEDPVDYLWVVPNRLEFNLGETFIPNRDLEVLVLYQGVVKSVSLNLVEIGIADATVSENLKNLPYDKGCVLDKAGKKIIVVNYGGLSTSCYIEVLDSGGNKVNTSPGIHVEWAKDEKDKR